MEKLINSGLYINAEILMNKELESDEKLVLAFANTFKNTPFKFDEVVEYLGFTSKRKLENTINRLMKKVDYSLVVETKEENLAFRFNSEHKDDLEKVVDDIKKKQEPKQQDLSFHKKVIDYFNEKTNSNYKSQTKSTIRAINGLLKKEYTFNDFKAVIDDRLNVWGNPKSPMHQYLTPSTLFRESNFEKYLNHYNTSKNEKAEKQKNVQEKRQDKYKKKGLFGD